MTYYIKTSILLFLLLLVSPYCKAQENVETTSYFLVRHSEKVLSDKNDRNPNLTEQGKKRSEKLATILKDVKVDFIYSTDYARTLQTAAPIAKSKNIEIKIYDPRKLYDDEFQKQTKGKTTVIVGHSNTTPVFVNKIIGSEKYKDLDEKDYSKLFIIHTTGDIITDTVLNID